MANVSPFEALQQLYASEFGPPGDFGSSFADALALRLAVRSMARHPDAAAAFEHVAGKLKSVEDRLRFTALVVDLSQSGEAGDKPSLLVAASTTFSSTLDNCSPLRVFQAFHQYPESFCQPPVASLSVQSLSHKAQHHPDPDQRQAALKAAQLVRVNMKMP